ncbi:unnamed protein product [Cyprideis torosa]|uniref:palmitoyl-protein hydrolase n=1 Tax=Cyprideis torosa TaxID=163714 RepID=A0A7R8ZXE4_9CRUS|nr:unnamed protein product [Cyprideis torosa]CAG0910171.1 unnamed protein product [Cyprideis torosa]
MTIQTSKSLLPHLEIETGDDITASVIWLHGLGASGHDFEPLVPELKLPADIGVRFIFPHAPDMPVTINNGYVMPAWYDILDASIDRKVDANQLRASASAVKQLIGREIERGIASDRIVIAGFSQGGAVGYEAALTYDKPLAGLMAMSTYFATVDSIQPSDANKALPIHIYHGSHDPIVPESLGQKAFHSVQKMGHTAEFSRYPMEHTLCWEQVQDIARQLSQWLPSPSSGN